VNIPLFFVKINYTFFKVYYENDNEPDVITLPAVYSSVQIPVVDVGEPPNASAAF